MESKDYPDRTKGLSPGQYVALVAFAMYFFPLRNRLNCLELRQRSAEWCCGQGLSERNRGPYFEVKSLSAKEDHRVSSGKHERASSSKTWSS